MKLIKLTITFLFALMTFSCSDNPLSSSLIYDRLETMSETDKMSLDSSEIIFADLIGEDNYSINFGESNAFLEAKPFDVLIRYGTSSSCDRDVFILNNRTSRWDQLGFQPDVVACLDVLTTKMHLLSTISLPIQDFVDSDGKVLVRYRLSHSKISGRLFGVSPDYF